MPDINAHTAVSVLKDSRCSRKNQPSIYTTKFRRKHKKCVSNFMAMFISQSCGARVGIKESEAILGAVRVGNQLKCF